LYQQQHHELKIHYLGQYVAMQNGKVIDHDPNFVLLRQRIRKQYANSPVMITLVEEAPIPTLVRHGFCQETTA